MLGKDWNTQTVFGEFVLDQLTRHAPPARP
jgi:hypothetical protein